MTNQQSIDRAKKALKKAKSSISSVSVDKDVENHELNHLEDHGKEDFVDGLALVGGIEEVDPEPQLVGELADRMDASKVRRAVTFDRHKNGLALVVTTWANFKIQSVEKFKPDVPEVALRHATRILQEEIMKDKKRPAHED